MGCLNEHGSLGLRDKFGLVRLQVHLAQDTVTNSSHSECPVKNMETGQGPPLHSPSPSPKPLSSLLPHQCPACVFRINFSLIFPSLSYYTYKFLNHPSIISFDKKLHRSSAYCKNNHLFCTEICKL